MPQGGGGMEGHGGAMEWGMYRRMRLCGGVVRARSEPPSTDRGGAGGGLPGTPSKGRVEGSSPRPEVCLTTQHLLRGGGSDPPPPLLSDWANFSPGLRPIKNFL